MTNNQKKQTRTKTSIYHWL